jgi:hypothetical protein
VETRPEASRARKGTVRLGGAQADAYLAVLRGLLQVARPGAHYPDPRRLDGHLALLGPEGSRGVHGGVDVDPASGLPSLRQLLAVRAERDVAAGYLTQHPRAASARAQYYRRLAASDVLAASSVDVRLRRRERSLVALEVVHERVDAASGLPLRYTLHLTQRGGRHAVVDGELARPTRRFTSLLERHAGADAELTLLLVSELPGVTVEEVVRGQIGPLSLTGLAVPELLRPVLEGVPGAVVLHLALDRAGTGVAEDRCRDPFTRLYRDSLSHEARELVERRRAALGYRVAKERRLVCTPSAEAPLRAALAGAGVPLVVRSR